MGLTIREGRKIARTAATIDQVYAGLAARGGGGARGAGSLIFSQTAAHEHMMIITGTF
jgi:hypothetical protein